MTYTIVSGGFDPIHLGHIQMMREASKKGKLIVILNNDNWLRTKKGFALMSQETRMEMLLEFNCVDNVILTNHIKDDLDITVCESLKYLRQIYPTEHLIFCNGGDRKLNNTPEEKLCGELNIETRYNVGGGKIESSRDIVKNAIIEIFERGYRK